MRKKHPAFLLTELIVAMTVTGIILVCLAISLDGFKKFNHYQLTRQHCIAAGQGQLDSIAVTGRQISEDDFNRLWPKMNCSIEKTAGTGQWEGLKLVKVKTKTNSFHNEVEIELSRYISGSRED